jgi:hypothetical protein
MPGEQAFHPFPWKAVFIAAAFEHLVPQPAHHKPEGPDGPTVHGHAVVSRVPRHKKLSLIACRLVILSNKLPDLRQPLEYPYSSLSNFNDYLSDR